MSNNNFKEKFIIKFKQKWIRNNVMTILLVAILLSVFVALNLWVQSIDLAQIDVTENKIYSLTDESKEMLKNIDKEVKIYLWEYVENSSVVDLIKQYCHENDKIKYEILTEELNKSKVEEFGLEAGYQIVVVEVGEKETILDGYSDFATYDYTTGQEIDLTEQAISNAIFNLTVDEKQKVYLLSGHGEYTTQELGLLMTYLNNEAYEYESLNLLSVNKIPENCDILLILSPTSDLLETEVNIITEYINKGGNIILTRDTEEAGKQYPNFQKVLDLYGVSIENGYVYETNVNLTVADYPVIIMPIISSYNKITESIYTDGGFLVLPYAQRVKTSDSETAISLGVEYETIINSSENSYYVTDVSADVNSATNSAEKGSIDIAVVATKTIAEESETEESKKSQLLVIGNGRFITDYTITSSSYPLSYLGNNRDFMLNGIASLTGREDTLKIRKQMNSSTYTPTQEQDIIVKMVIFGVPILIIIFGIIVWQKRKQRR